MKAFTTGFLLLTAFATNVCFASPQNAQAKADSTAQPTKQQINLGNGKTYPTSKLQFTNASKERLKDLPANTELYPVSNPYNSYNHDFQGTYTQQQNNRGK